MDIPFVRFILPVAVLGLFYWALIVNPLVEDTQPADPRATGALTPDQARELMDQSKALLLQNKRQEALPSMLRLHAAFPENHIYIEQLATTYAALGRFAEEAQMWERFLQYAPTPVDACPQIGIAYRNQGKDAESEKAFQRCYEIEPNPDNTVFYAHCLEQRGELGKAARLYSEGLKRAPQYGDLSIGLARIDLFRKRPQSALGRAVDVLKRSPNNVDALLAAGLASARLGNVRDAREYLERGASLSPNYRDIRVALAGLPKVRTAAPDRSAAAAKRGGRT